jgi:hypothetical protein
MSTNEPAGHLEALREAFDRSRVNDRIREAQVSIDREEFCLTKET